LADSDFSWRILDDFDLYLLMGTPCQVNLTTLPCPLPQDTFFETPRSKDYP